MDDERSTRKRFSEEEKIDLNKAYDEGLDSTKKENVPKIQVIAKRLKRSEEEIKNWIGNERRARKGKTASKEAIHSKKPPQKLRAPNCYNLFVKDFFKSPEGQCIKDLSERNRIAAKKWLEKDGKEKQKYQQLAAQLPAVSAVEDCDKWHETQRVLKNMQENCEWAQKLGIHMCYVLCNENNHYAGGTSTGRKFLESNPQIPLSFMVSTNPGITPAPPEPKTLKDITTAILNQLNMKYSLAVGNPHSRVPYSKLTDDNVVGWPSSVKLRHPSLLTQSDIKLIHDSIDSIKFVGVPPDVATITDDHQYCKPSRSIEMHPPKPGHTSLSVCGSRSRDVCLAEAAAEEVKCGGTVNLLSSNYKVIGTAITISGNILHGQELPNRFVKVAVQTINDGIKAWLGLNDDGCVLTPGSITAWPIGLTRKIKL